ncbi:protein of unknown function [Pseudotevenvirus RB43]|uniref:Uncharacterized protein n=2 Tax=Pseudotevenvirus RB43 TaxID=115991 RepID=Q56BS4_9CAUD|nr:hypothetical protein RB43ORF124c [Escherichia phage RB43]AAX78646.1 hypothetical protein RB43ORF124c [Escherichia phage RB43]CCK73972.1 protein of unknown function [Pseudotevenvirus RB43]CCL97589.1 protein of unknown function [Pseudotevenvirus RB43]
MVASIIMLIIAVVGMIAVIGCVLSGRKVLGLWATVFILCIALTVFPLMIYDVITDIIWWARVL